MGSITQRQISSALAILSTFLLSYQTIYSLSVLKSTVDAELYLIRCAVALSGFFFPILLGWMSFRLIGGLVIVFFAAVMVFFVGSIARSSVFGWFLVEYAALCFALFRLEEYYRNQIAGLEVDFEKSQNEKNDLDLFYKGKGEGISIYFEKYSTYYNLRMLAEELAKTLSVTQLSQTVAHRTLDFIPRGDIALVALVDLSGRNLSVAASRRMTDSSPVYEKKGDMFDQLAIRNRKRLIVTDAHQDFRFDVKETMRQRTLRSLIIAPLLQEGRVMGTLRINSSDRETFTNDDLRLLDAIATLASSALSNAMLYERTEELAIRDSLTGLYLRRYFFERLKEEHRRALVTNRPLAVLMCDLDHFKECNDRFGHGAGDQMLVRFAKILKEFSENAFVARYGGEEFSVLLPETTKKEAVKLANRLRENVEVFPFAIRREKVTMTISIGVACLPEDTLDLETLVQKADQALYRAKREGRNRVCLSGS